MITGGNRQIRVGLVGGGPGAGIAETHRIAMRLDNRYVIVAGVFSRDPEKSRVAGQQLNIPEDRLYADYVAMAEQEAERKNSKIDAVVIVTQTASHYAIARKFLEAGIHVICDKPLCLKLTEARELKALVEKRDLIFCLTHNYSGYAMVRHAARMVRNGDVGEVKVVQAEHASGWAIQLLEKEGNPQAAWRTDPDTLGDASVLYDLGTHAHQLSRFVTGLEVTQVAAEMNQIVEGRAIKDNANLLLRFSNGARGSLWASMAAAGNEHGLCIRVFGDRGGLAWHHEDPHHLRYCPMEGPPQILAQGAKWLSPDARRWTRAGLGHPEGFFEAFANLYTEVADALLAKAERSGWVKSELGFPEITDGVRGVSFVESAMRSYANGGAWTQVEPT
ncbi:MAG: Gfo/Idh/MocA family oxidoreductase [Verrucomicrobia bacterium]|nr:Gfo/Idh/MocA family oxidoreductase [Verrucomicrobiota bacterium]